MREWQFSHLPFLSFWPSPFSSIKGDLVWHTNIHAWVPAVKINIKHDDTVAKLCHFLPGKEDHYDNKTINQYSNVMKSWNIKTNIKKDSWLYLNVERYSFISFPHCVLGIYINLMLVLKHHAKFLLKSTGTHKYIIDIISQRHKISLRLN